MNSTTFISPANGAGLFHKTELAQAAGMLTASLFSYACQSRLSWAIKALQSAGLYGHQSPPLFDISGKCSGYKIKNQLTGHTDSKN